jgi:glycosyltransferase involved in cell wall biosynthesis
VVKGWPRLSETFIAQELLALEARGLRFEIWSLRRPQGGPVHALHQRVAAKVRYLPEYLHHEPLRALLGVLGATTLPGFGAALRAWFADFSRDVSRNRIRRFGQACVLAMEAPAQTRALYAHFLHTPGSVTRYAALMRRAPWGFSAHARDIWTIPDWEKREKIAAARFGVVCTRAGHAHLRNLSDRRDKVALVYHGLDLARFPAPPSARTGRDGGDAADPLRLVTVGRLVEKKGYDVLVEALAELPLAMHWRLAHIGGGPLLQPLQRQAAQLGVLKRMAFRGPAPQGEVIKTLRWGDVFVLPSRVAQDGDRDGLPNVLMEAASQMCPIVSTNAGAITEFIENGVHGVLVKPGDPLALAEALMRLGRRPSERRALAQAALARLREHFGAEAGADAVAARIKGMLAAADAG